MVQPVDVSAIRGRAPIQSIDAYLRLFIRRLNKYHGARMGKVVEKSQLAAQQH